MEQKTNLKKDIGLLIATALVAGNMMGSGIFMLPATLAGITGPGGTIMAWLISAACSICLAITFARLGSKYPKTGGPYEYSKVAFGEFTGFMNAWLYWNGSWIGNAAVILAICTYTSSLVPALSNGHVAFIFGTIVLWIFTGINILGVRRAGKIQTVITIFEICFFIFFIIITALHFNVANIKPLFPSGKGLSTVNGAAVNTLWAFIGLESAAITAGEIKNPEKNVKRSTILGISIAAVIYICINFFAMGSISQEALANSKAPFADILSQYFGGGVSTFITLAVIISILGTTVGWLLSTARVGFAAAENGVFPKAFGKVHPKFETPYVSLIIGSVLLNILLYMNYNKSLVGAFTFVILLATLAYLPVYAMTALAEIKIMMKNGQIKNFSTFIKCALIPLIGFVYACWAIYGSGWQVIGYGALLAALGVPFYFYMKKSGRRC
ncbi:amino acid permease [Clostridium sp. YIM B02505]|uniref:Amino acid permease n=1 Tax=Clostridium yunnanense TaxID=2800325 RepID=A0ABS1EP18_9CLOT|nr:amino acid permease [Clostridium yunnanense]